MKTIHRASLVLTLLCSVASLADAQTTMLAPQAERISDSVITQDYAAFERLQERIKLLNDGGRRVADYHLAKAQCWLDVSFHEYTRNDRSAFPQAAMTESEKLIAAMEQRVTPLPDDTPLVNGAARLRPDLWARTASLHQNRGFSCAAQRLACAEVELVHAGNEYNQQQWRHAKPYVQIAEDAIVDAESAAGQCGRVAAAPPLPVPAERPPVQRTETRRVLAANIVFGFDRSDRAGIRPAGMAALERLLAATKRDGAVASGSRFTLTGHADRLNSTGNAAYNQRLSEKRAATVKALLVERGFAADSIDVSATGDVGQVEACDKGKRSEAELEECLLPNRRVEVVLTTVESR